MGLLDEMRQGREYPLRLDAILADLPDDDRADVLSALADPRISHSRVAAVLTAHGYRCHPSSVGRWRAK
jgi:hypothetical protein